MQTNAAIVGQFQQYLRDISQVLMRKYSRGLVWEREDISPELARSTTHYGDEMSIIMLWSMAGLIVLKIHFDTKFALALAAHATQKKPEEITPMLANEFLKEYSNFQGGHLRGIFEVNNLLAGMSLPFLAKGTDEVIFTKIRDPRMDHGVWRLTSGNMKVVCTTEVCFLDTAPIEKIMGALKKDVESGNKSDDSDDGDVQFF